MMVGLSDPVTALDGVGPSLARRLADAFSIATVRDLLEHYPRRYQDAGDVLDLSEVAEGEPATLIGEVLDSSRRRTPAKGRRRPLDIAQARVRQASAAECTATLFNPNWP